MTEIDSFKYRPLVSIFLTIPLAEKGQLAPTISSIQSQIYPDWEVCIVARPEAVPKVRKILGRAKIPDRRAGIVPLHDTEDPAGAAGASLQSASGQYFITLNCGDILNSSSLYHLVRSLQEDPAPDVVYSDEAVIGRFNFPSSIRFKPGFSPDLLLSAPYHGRLLALNTLAVRQAGGIRGGAGPAWEYDLVLKLACRRGAVAHLPVVLYYSRRRPAGEDLPRRETGDDPYLRVLQEHLARMQIDGTAEKAGLSARYRVRRQIAGEPLISLIIPTRDRVDLLSPCIGSICSRSTYPRFEVLVIDNQSSEQVTKDYFSRIAAEHDNLRIIPYDQPFHPSAIKNAATRKARGEYLLFLNNDIEVISPGWIDALLEQAQREEVACAGAKLLYPNRTVQHAGVVIGPDGFADHILRFAPADRPDRLWGISCIRNYRTLTGACMLIHRKKLRELGGFDEGYRAGFGDLDLCLRAHARGYLNVYTPYAELYHHESASLAASPAAAFHTEDAERFFTRWGTELESGDPYYNPNLPYHDFCLKYF